MRKKVGFGGVTGHPGDGIGHVGHKERMRRMRREERQGEG
jgi:hypothetical protein